MEGMTRWMDEQTNECMDGITTYEGILRARHGCLHPHSHLARWLQRSQLYQQGSCNSGRASSRVPATSIWVPARHRDSTVPDWRMQSLSTCHMSLQQEIKTLKPCLHGAAPVKQGKEQVTQTSGKRERTLRLEEQQRGEEASMAGDALWPGAPFPRGELCKALSLGPGTQQVHNKACFSPSPSTALGHSPGRGVQAP